MKNNHKDQDKNKEKKTTWDFATNCVHSGATPDETTGAVSAPVYLTSTFAQTSPGVHQGYEYSRTHNPTRTRLEECLRDLEQGEQAITTATGLSAIMLMMHALKPNSTILCGDDVYGGTYRLFTTIFSSLHQFHFLDTTNLNLLEEEVKKKKPALLWLETPTNPLLKITDIKNACSIAHQHGCLSAVDNTFFSPALQNPLSLGADIVMHSLTKYINGHSDCLGGALIVKEKTLAETLRRLQNSIGPSLSPFDSWLIFRGVKTLHLRMKQHCESALVLAKWLQGHSKVEKVLYPGLETHPQYKIHKQQSPKGDGGMIGVFLKGGIEESKKFLSNTHLFTLAESLGGVESLIEHPAIMTHASVPKEIRASLGIHDNFVRLSVGIESTSALQEDLERALRF